MFEMWKLKRRLRKIGRTKQKETKKLKKRKADSYAFQQLEWDEQEAIKDAENFFDYKEGQRLRQQAVALDVEIPPTTDLTMWVDDTGESGLMWFTSRGRAHVRKLVDEEKARRFEVRTLWVTKIILPLAGLIIGIIGAITGLIAVSRKAPQQEKKPPAFERLMQVGAGRH